MRVIMIDKLSTCEQYMKAREHTVKGWHKIEVAPPNSKEWRIKTSTIKKQGVKIGYISKRGFNYET